MFCRDKLYSSVLCSHTYGPPLVVAPVKLPTDGVDGCSLEQGCKDTSRNINTLLPILTTLYLLTWKDYNIIINEIESLHQRLSMKERT